MNFLAHAYLSFGHKEVLVGNMISDFVKGNAAQRYPPGIRSGILLHRQIDEFTDQHPVTREAKEVFRPHYRLFSGVITDILFDHFLANDPHCFAPEGLLAFSQEVYRVLEEYSAHLPPHFIQAFAYMKTENWLYQYHTTPAMEKSIRGLVRRSSFFSDSHTAFELFLQHYSFLQQCFTLFFKDVKIFAKQQFDRLTA
ncbi:ACP phosphodiesterase [Paraflavisolibacter sp. H34]|uniref:acyl carrier protein phosphodiesterase n=1 Tax=Huijunlia imazamoxiresistens TaxID=3127457 RepID=UPI00301964B2